MKEPIAAADSMGWRKAWEAKDERERMKSQRETYKIYRNDWDNLLKQYLKARFSDQTYRLLEQQLDISINPLRWASDELAKIYSKPPQRSVAGVESVDGEDPLDPYTADGALDMALDQAARICYATRSIVISPMVPEGEQRVIVDLIPSHRVFVQHDHVDRTKLRLIVIERSDGTFEAWDDEEQVIFDKAYQPKSREPNRYGLIPYVVALASYPASGYWQVEDSFGLEQATYLAATAKTEHNHLRHLQSHKQGWVRNDGEVPFEVLSDPASWVHVRGQNSQIGALDMQANLREHLETMLDATAQTLALYGIRPESVRGSLDAQSGYALSIKLRSQEAVWAQQRMIWEMWEQRLYSVARAVLAVDAGVALPEGRLELDWAELGASASPLELAQLHEIQLRSGVISVAQAQREQGYTPQQIEQIEEEKLEEGAGLAIPAMEPLTPEPPPMDAEGPTTEDAET